jgi:hypothetical protein
VDIGLKESGLVHISQMANRYIKSPYDVVAVGDVITVWVMEVKPGEKKISLSMIRPGQERRPPERGGRFAEPRGDRPERGGQRAERPPQQPAPPPADRGQGQGGFQPRGERPGFQPRQDRSGYPQRQGQGGRFGGRGPAQGSGGPPAPPQGATPGVGAQQPAPPAAPPPPPKKPGKPKPLPNLSTEKKTGKAALQTFAELAAFFKPPEPEKPKEEPKAEQPKPEPPKPDEPPAAPPPEAKPDEPKPEGGA